MGFGKGVVEDLGQENNILHNVESEDLIQFGLIPELIGRLPVVSTLNPLSGVVLLDILQKPRNALIKQYQKLFEMDGVKLSFEPDALERVVDIAKEKEMGARGLRAVLETLMFQVMFELPSRTNIEECVITLDFIEKNSPPTYLYSKKPA